MLLLVLFLSIFFILLTFYIGYKSAGIRKYSIRICMFFLAVSLGLFFLLPKEITISKKQLEEEAKYLNLETVNVGVFANTPYIIPTGDQTQGIDANIVEEALKHMGYRPNFINLEKTESPEYISTLDIQVIIGGIFENSFMYEDISLVNTNTYMRTHIVAVSSENSLKEKKFTFEDMAESLQGATVGIYNYLPHAEELAFLFQEHGILVKSYNNTLSLAMDIEDKKVSVGILDFLGYNDYTKKIIDTETYQVELLFPDNLQTELNSVFLASSSLEEDINKAILELQDTGYIHHVTQEY